MWHPFFRDITQVPEAKVKLLATHWRQSFFVQNLLKSGMVSASFGKEPGADDSREAAGRELRLWRVVWWRSGSVQTRSAHSSSLLSQNCAKPELGRVLSFCNLFLNPRTRRQSKKKVVEIRNMFHSKWKKKFYSCCQIKANSSLNCSILSPSKHPLLFCNVIGLHYVGILCKKHTYKIYIAYGKLRSFV